MEKFFQLEAERLERVNPTMERLITPLVKKGLVDMLIACRDRPWITRRGNVLEMFCRGEAVENKKCAKTLLRIIYLLPPDLECVQRVKKNMVQYALMSEDLEASPREVEWDYTWRLLRVIKNMRRTKGLECNATMYSLAMLNKKEWDQGNYMGYYFGSVNLQQWVTAFLAKEQAREALLDELEGRPVVSADIVAERNRLTLAQLQERRLERRRRLEEEQTQKEEEQGGDVPEQD